MTQEQRRVWLLEYLLKESREYGDWAVPADEEGQRRLLRSLFNVRPPEPVTEEFLRVQDEYLTQRSRERGITDASGLPPVGISDQISLWLGDITTLRCGAIVNAANSKLLGCFQPCHDCIDNFIHTFAGVQLRLKCHQIMTAQGRDERTGTAKITPGYNLPAGHVLHTVGPIIQWSVSEGDRELLRRCYTSCLDLAAENGVKDVAFCCISTGVFRFPKDQAAAIAVETVTDYLQTRRGVERVIFNVHGREDLRLYQGLLY